MRSRAGEQVHVKDQFDGRGRVVITASSATEYSYDGDNLSGEGQPSIFTEAVVEGLETGQADRDGDKWISVDELYDYVYDRVKERTPNQSPNKLSTLEGSLRIARSVYDPPVEPAELDRRLLADIKHSEAEVRLAAVTELTTLLSTSDKGIGLAARVALSRMAHDTCKPVAEQAAAALARTHAVTFEHARELTRVLAEDQVVSVTFSPDGRRIATASSIAQVWDCVSGLQLIRGGPSFSDFEVTDVAFGPDGQRLAYATAVLDGEGNSYGRAMVCDSASGRDLVSLDHGDRVLSVAFSPDGSWIATGGCDNTARVWDSATGRELFRATHEDIVTDVAFSPSGTLIATASFDGTVRVWDSASDSSLLRADPLLGVRVWEGAGSSNLVHTHPVHGVAFNPDGTMVATASSDGTARIWDRVSSRELIRVTHDDRVLAVAFSPDGTLIATASADRTARVWDSANGQELARLTHDDCVTDVALSIDGSRIATSTGGHRTVPRTGFLSGMLGPRREAWGYAIVWVSINQWPRQPDAVGPRELGHEVPTTLGTSRGAERPCVPRMFVDGTLSLRLVSSPQRSTVGCPLVRPRRFHSRRRPSPAGTSSSRSTTQPADRVS
jgi:WD40 repeat protein